MSRIIKYEYLKLNKNLNNISKTVFFILGLSLFVDYYLFLDLSTGGSSKDFKNTFPVVINLANLELKEWSEYTRHFPLHYFLLSLIYRIFENVESVRLVYIFFSLTIPLFIYINLKKIYKEFDKNKLFLFSCLIFLLPFVRSSIVWANAHNTGLIFFLIASYFFLDFLVKKNNTQMILSIVMLSCSVYSVQYYAVFFLIFLYKVYEKYGFDTLINYFLFCVLASLPGFYFLKIIPSSSDIPFSKNFFNVLMINLSIMFFYFLSFINKDSFKIIKFNYLNNKYNFIYFVFSLIIIFIGSYHFNYEFSVGGGLIYKFSTIFTGSKYLFFISSFFGLIFLLFSEVQSKKNYIEFFLVFLCFFLMTSSYMIFKKYFEPTFILICLFFLKRSFFKSIFKIYINLLYISSYYLLYYLSSIIYLKFIF